MIKSNHPDNQRDRDPNAAGSARRKRGRLTVLGGSSPFTAALADALVARGDAIAPQALVLAGRDPKHLDIVSRYVRHRLSGLGWSVDWTTDTRAALRGAEVVLHQVRYGGNAGRQSDEELALACELMPDETLGPAALQSALRIAPQLDATCAMLVRECPDAWVLNMTNPLSVTTARMVRSGVKCIGVCELPRVTVQKAAAALGEDPREAAWSYVGLNHRGFVVGLAWNGVDRIGDLAGRLGNDTLDGIRAEEIRALGAIPTKYFRLVQGDALPPCGGRAVFLEVLRHEILEELRSNPERSPPSLRQRYLAWYPQAVVPLIEALLSARPTLLEVNALTYQGLVEEGRVPVSATMGVGAIIPAQAPLLVSYWIERFRRHESLVLDAVEHPSFHTIRGALIADPMVPSSKAETCARLLWKNLRRACRAGHHASGPDRHADHHRNSYDSPSLGSGP
jgi:6-phospho-beta-glucosidase